MAAGPANPCDVACWLRCIYSVAELLNVPAWLASHFLVVASCWRPQKTQQAAGWEALEGFGLGRVA
jgi:hypothetical protein